MGAWEKWLYHGEDENDKPFPCLRQLIMKECPKLKGGCTLSLPSLVELHIDGCNGGLFKWLACLTSMTKMEIGKIPELVHFEGSLSTSWVSLEEMKIVECPRFKSFVEVDGEQQVPPKLKFLEISGCGELEKVPEYLFGLPSLNEMSIVDCEKFSSFPNGELPVSLRKLMLRKCPRLPQSQLISSGYYLEEVSLHNVEGLMSITELAGVGSPVSQSLLKLEIVNCRSLTTLTDNLQHLSVLSQLSLWDCPALETSIFPSLPFSLKYFILYSCPKVKDLPRDMHTLESLISLSIENCEGIERLPPRGLPPNLKSLCIGGCKILNQPIQEWGLRGLIGIQEFSISGGMGCLDEMECFPPDDEDWSGLFPSSLLRLSIRRMKKLERMGWELKYCLASLQSLIIFNCPRLRQLPEDGLPDSLERLYIWGCTAELLEICSKGKGEYWPHLRLIPDIYIPN